MTLHGTVDHDAWKKPAMARSAAMVPARQYRGIYHRSHTISPAPRQSSVVASMRGGNHNFRGIQTDAASAPEKQRWQKQ